MTHTFQVGEKIRLNVPDNSRLHGAEAKIITLETWGAHVLTTAAARGKFRALFGEMEEWRPALLSSSVGEDVDVEKPTITQMGYTGDFCETCGSSKMRRVGACLCCEDCGTSTGC